MTGAAKNRTTTPLMLGLASLYPSEAHGRGHSYPGWPARTAKHRLCVSPFFRFVVLDGSNSPQHNHRRESCLANWFRDY